MAAPRIQLIHAVTAAQAPIHDAFERFWPETRTVDLADLSLASDLAEAGALTDDFTRRMTALVRYAVDNGADAVLFTCSAFGAAIEAARDGIAVPVLKPDEAMIEAALAKGPRIGALATFEPTIASLFREIEVTAAALGVAPEPMLRYVPGALDALNAGDPATHDRLLAEAAEMAGIDVLMLAQFSMIGAKDACQAALPGVPVLTAPDEAIRKLMGLLGA